MTAIRIATREIYLDTKLRKSMQVSSYEAASLSATQEFLKILWNTKVHYHVHKRLPHFSILSQIKPVHTVPSYFSNIHLNIVLPPMLGLLSGLFPSGFPPKSYMHSSSPSSVLHALPISSSLVLSF
jgi:hypothetical protein